ncbi:AaceriABL154Wp [[Ashbya] aceris (nom. inval.)]|nr:AaceriABL154Wp [[Ashbya] aceris (nom. inval.)]
MPKPTGRRAKPSKSKAVEQQRCETQEEFYERAIQLEEQAERWILSDVVKSLRFYSQAYTAYEQGLFAREPTDNDTYNILYNQSRLLLKVFSEYRAADDYIDLLSYVNLDAVPEASSILLPLPAIVSKFEAAVARFPEKCGWDLYFNLLTCFLMYLEAADEVPEFETSYARFEAMAYELLQRMQREIESLEPLQAKEEDLPPSGEQPAVASMESSTTETVEMMDSASPQGLADSLVLIYRAVQLALEAALDGARFSLPDPDIRNRLLLSASRLRNNVEGAHSFACGLAGADTKELRLARHSLECLDALLATDLARFEALMQSADPADIDAQLCNVDLLQTATTYIQDLDTCWKLCGLLDRTLRTCQELLTAERSRIISTQSDLHRLSPTVFRLCDVLTSRADNDVHRLYIQKQGAAETGVLRILYKNARTLLGNSAAFAQKSCGFREYVTDKLKRNYVYHQAQRRLLFFDGQGGEATEAHTAVHEVMLQQPYYCVLPSAELQAMADSG